MAALLYRLFFMLGVLIPAVCWSAPVFAQYYYPPGDPCAGITGQGFSNGYMYQMTAAQQAAACQQARAAAYQRQRAEQAAAQARAAEEQRVADHARAVEAARVAAEESPDNICRKPEMAGELIKTYNGMDWEEWPKREVVDIEHLVTLQSDTQNHVLACHGVWVHSHGERIEGTLTMKPNIAGDIIANWKPEGWTPVISDPPPALAAVAPTAPPLAPAVADFQQGMTDRRAWEDWFATTSGDYRTGALYWSGQRSLAHPGSCDALGGPATASCIAAQARLSLSDARRKSDPQYRAGWNSVQASGQ